jgi:ribosomal-protein-alanine N-acetyltransferase
LSDAGFKVREFNLKDLERVMQINAACLPENYSSYFYRDLYQRYPQSFRVAEVENTVQGYIMCRIERGWSKMGKLTPTRLCHIVSIAVMEDYRRRGIGRELIVQAMRKGREVYDTSEGYLEVRISNDAAIGLYDVLGFKKVKRNYGYYMDGEDAWVMAASLDDI